MSCMCPIAVLRRSSRALSKYSKCGGSYYTVNLIFLYEACASECSE